jgi:hypothetical protein
LTPTGPGWNSPVAVLQHEVLSGGANALVANFGSGQTMPDEEWQHGSET